MDAVVVPLLATLAVEPVTLQPFISGVESTLYTPRLVVPPEPVEVTVVMLGLDEAMLYTP